MPERAAVKGVGFVEFATDEEERRSTWSRMLERLGFRKTAVHRTKKVTPLRAGRYPHPRQRRCTQALPDAAYAVHGTSRLCDGAGRRRCRRRPTPGPWRSMPNPSASRLPRASWSCPPFAASAAGSIYLIDDKSPLGRFSEIDFEAVSATEGDAGVMPALLRVDHIAQTVAYEEMLTWLLFYTSIFETGKDADGRYHRSRRRGAQPGGSKTRPARCGSP